MYNFPNMRIALSLLGIIVLLILSIPTGVHLAGLHPKNTHEFDFNFKGQKALIIATNHGVLNKPGEETGKRTGLFLSELSIPYFHFIEAGLDVEIASIEGGDVPLEPTPFFIKTSEDNAFESNPLTMNKLKNSKKIDDLDFTEYSIILISGGWGAAYDLGYSNVLGQKITDAYYNSDAILAGICHGVLGFIRAMKPNGDFLIAGRKMTGVTDKQVKELGISITPMHPETELKRVGVTFKSQTNFRDIFSNYTIVDDEKRFVTSQNQNGGHDISYTILELLQVK